MDSTEVIAGLYGGTLDDELWANTMTQLADRVGASGAQLVSVNPTTGRVLRDESHRLDPSVGDEYRLRWSTRDILIEPFFATPVGVPHADHQLVSRETWESSPIFNELALPSDTPYILATMLHKAPDKLVALSMKASTRHGPFRASEARRLRAIIPHLQRALAIKDRLQLAQVRGDTLGHTLDGLSVGILILDARGRIVEASDAARTIMTNDTGLRSDPDGRIRLRGAAHAKLYGWIDAGIPPRSNVEGLLQIPRENASALTVTVAPLPLTVDVWLASSPRWLLLVVDPERQIRASTLLIEKDLSLTPREAQIAALLVAGYDLRAVATRSNINLSTVRSHLKSIFAKTGLRSQVELVQRIRNGPALLGR